MTALAPGQILTIAIARTGLPLPCKIFSGAAITIAPVGGKQIEIGEALQPEPAVAVHDGVTRIGRAEMRGLSGIGADGFRAEAKHAALMHQEFHRADIRPRGVLAGGVEILVRDRIAALRPVGAHQQP